MMRPLGQALHAVPHIRGNNSILKFLLPLALCRGRLGGVSIETSRSARCGGNGLSYGGICKTENQKTRHLPADRFQRAPPGNVLRLRTEVKRGGNYTDLIAARTWDRNVELDHGAGEIRATPTC